MRAMSTVHSVAFALAGHVGRSQAIGVRVLSERKTSAFRPRASSSTARPIIIRAVAANAASSNTEARPKDLQPSDAFRRFFSIAASLSKGALCRAMIAALLNIVAGLSIPVLIGGALNALVLAASGPGPAAAERFFKSLLPLVVLFLIDCIGRFLYVRNMTSMVDRAVLNLRVKALRAIGGVDASFFDSARSSELAEVISSDCSALRSLMWGILRRDRGVTAFSDAFLGICVVMSLSPALAMVYLTLVPLIAFLSARTGLAVAALMGKEAMSRSKVVSRTREALSSWKTVMSYGANEREFQMFEGNCADVDSNISRRLRPTKALDDFLSRFSICFVLSSLLAAGGWLVSYGHIPLKAYLATQPFLWSITFATQGVIYSISDLGEIRRLLGKIYSAADRAEAVASQLASGETGTLRHVQGRLELRNVTFAYASRPTTKVLNNFCLSIEAGKTTALVAKSGMGKTTISALVSRFYTPQQGQILLDGVDVSTLNRSWYSEQIGMVSQHPVLFSGTTAEAIAYGVPDRLQPVSRAKIVEAAKLANAHDFIMSLPEGYETEVGERGSRFSGGQLQRLAIARAVIRESPVLLLDEATSALDAESEKKVQEALNRLTIGKTVLVIAHRLSTIRDASKIVVLEAHGIAESGSYSELMAANGAFADLMKTQTTTVMSD